MQVLDPQGWPEVRHKIKDLFKKWSLETIQDIMRTLEKKGFFSDRHFPPQPNLIQVQVKLNQRSPFHIEFLLTAFLKQFPTLMAMIKEKKPIDINKDMIINLSTHK